jgi:hypothetical protein
MFKIKVFTNEKTLRIRDSKTYGRVKGRMKPDKNEHDKNLSNTHKKRSKNYTCTEISSSQIYLLSQERQISLLFKRSIVQIPGYDDRPVAQLTQLLHLGLYLAQEAAILGQLGLLGDQHHLPALAAAFQTGKASRYRCWPPIGIKSNDGTFIGGMGQRVG